MKNRLETMAWLQELKNMNVVEIVNAIDAYYEDLSNELPEPPKEVFIDIDAPVVVEEAPTIEDYVAPKVGDVIVVDDPKYDYYKTGTPEQEKKFLLALSDALSSIEDIEHESMILNDGSENVCTLRWLTLDPKKGYDKPYRVHNAIVMEVWNNENEDIDPVLIRECQFYLNEVPKKLQTTLERLGIFKYDRKTGYPSTHYFTI